MPLNLASPGIVVREVDLTIGRVDPVSGSIGALAGPFERGPVGLPQVIESEDDLFSTFGWLWLPIIYFRKSLSVRFYIVAILCFFITVSTLDHTRVFMLLSLPVLIYLSEKVAIVEYAEKASQFFPIWILLFFQFQKWSGGVFDTAWSSFWAPEFARILGLQ